jgi:hypothetical protein
MHILYSPLVGGPLAGFFGFIVAGELSANLASMRPGCGGLGARLRILTAFLQWRIKPSTNFVVVTGGLEMLIVLGGDLRVHQPRPPSGTRITLDVFNPSKIPREGSASSRRSY